MKSPKNAVLLILAIATIGGAALAWKQYQELIGLRAGALGNDERADLQKRLWDAEKRAKELADQLAALRGQGGLDEDGGVVASTDTPRAEAQGRRGGRGGQRGGGPGGGPNAMMALLEQPEVQKLMAMQQKAQLDGRYAALFKSLNLSPEQLEKFKTLLVEKQTAAQDVMAAALAQGINPREDPEAFRKMIASTQAEVDQSIKAAIGEDGFAKYENYQQTTPQRNVVSQLQQSLSYTAAPLSDTQAAQLVQILAQTSPRNPGGNRSGETLMEANVTVSVGGPGGGRGGGFGGGMVNIGFGGGGGGGGGGGTATITNEAITLAQGVLAPAQVQSLQQLQQQQQAQQQLQQAQQAIRQSQDGQRGNGGRNNSGNSGSTPATPAKKG